MHDLQYLRPLYVKRQVNGGPTTTVSARASATAPTLVPSPLPLPPLHTAPQRRFPAPAASATTPSASRHRSRVGAPRADPTMPIHPQRFGRKQQQKTRGRPQINRHEPSSSINTLNHIGSQRPPRIIQFWMCTARLTRSQGTAPCITTLPRREAHVFKSRSWRCAATYDGRILRVRSASDP